MLEMKSNMRLCCWALWEELCITTHARLKPLRGKLEVVGTEIHHMLGGGQAII